MLHSFRYAGEGIIWSFANNRNFRIFILIGVFVVLASIFLKVERIEFIILLFTVGLNIIAELINTAIEEMTNLITIKWSKQAKIAKDVAAAMSLTAAFFAVVVGLVIFMPYLQNL